MKLQSLKFFMILTIVFGCKQSNHKISQASKVVQKDTIYYDSLAILSPNGSVRWMIDTVVVDSAYRGDSVGILNI
jgi:hypothetical protein